MLRHSDLCAVEKLAQRRDGDEQQRPPGHWLEGESGHRAGDEGVQRRYSIAAVWRARYDEAIHESLDRIASLRLQ